MTPRQAILLAILVALLLVFGWKILVIIVGSALLILFFALIMVLLEYNRWDFWNV